MKHCLSWIPTERFCDNLMEQMIWPTAKTTTAANRISAKRVRSAWRRPNPSTFCCANNRRPLRRRFTNAWNSSSKKVAFRATPNRTLSTKGNWWPRWPRWSRWSQPTQPLHRFLKSSSPPIGVAQLVLYNTINSLFHKDVDFRHQKLPKLFRSLFTLFRHRSKCLFLTRVGFHWSWIVLISVAFVDESEPQLYTNTLKSPKCLTNRLTLLHFNAAYSMFWTHFNSR